MPDWMVTARGTTKEIRPASNPWWKDADYLAAHKNLHTLAPNGLFSVEHGGRPGERDAVKADVSVQAKDAAAAEAGAGLLLRHACPWIEFTEFSAAPLAAEHVALHWATPSHSS
jgi:hypothetical protein